MRRLFSALFLLIVVSSITLGAVELLSRLIFSQENETSRMARSNLVEAHAQLLREMRDPFPPSDSADEYVIFLGDSFTYGYTQSAQNSFPAAYERCIKRRGLPYKVLNFGISSSGIIGQSYFLEKALNERMQTIKIKAVVALHSQNDRYIEHWGLHPYEVCNGYPYAKYRELHYKSFVAYYLDYILQPKSHFKNEKLFKEPITEACLKEHFNKFELLTKERDIPLFHLYHFDSIKNESMTTEQLQKTATEFFESFQQDFPADYIQVNPAFNNVASYQSLYAEDNYHYNQTANAMIGEYLCDKIEL